ncbi:MAG: virulence factor SrfB [Succinivibrionaceae bacterium]
MKKNYLAACIDITNYNDDEEIILFEKTGIQFVDYEFEVNWRDGEDYNFNDLNKGDEDVIKSHQSFIKDICKGSFGYINVDNEKRIVRCLRKNDNNFLAEGCSEKVSPIEDFQISYEYSLRLYNGVWFPVPYFRKDESNRCKSPINWVRCRIVDISKRDGDGEYESDIRKYHVTFAFDTVVSPKNTDEKFSPINDDVASGTLFKFYSGINATNYIYYSIDNKNYWIKNWSNYIFTEIGKKEKFYKDEENYKGVEEGLSVDDVSIAHYLNVISLLQNLVHPHNIKLKTVEENSADKFNVSLILDIGNSRCSGFLNEDDGTNQTEDFSECTYALKIRDLNAPHFEYDDTFESRIEFQKANFDVNNLSNTSGRTNAFMWRSLVRVGHEATRLAANSKGNNGDTGLYAPKRYLWNLERHNTAWNYNTYSYQVPFVDKNGKFDGYFKFAKNTDTTVYDGDQILKNLVTGLGDARFASLDEQSFEPNFSYKSATTFMLVELILQAIGQMNSIYHRLHSTNSKLVRHLSNIVLTTPPSMSEQEKEIYRFCAYEALGIVWKCLGYDKSPGYIEGKDELSGTVYPYNFPIFSEEGSKTVLNTSEMVIPVPDVKLEWDEALSSQFVYLYNEIGHLYKANPTEFINSIRRFDADGRFNEYTKYKSDKSGDLLSARVASLDIGGGTTDLVITDYSFEADVSDSSSDLITRVILKDGFKIAGDDILLYIMRHEILKPLEQYLSSILVKNRREDKSKAIMQEILGNGKGSDNIENKNKRKQLVEQIFSKVGSRIMSYLSDLDRLPKGVTECFVNGKISDFINDTVTFSQQFLNRDKLEQKPFVYPEQWVIDSVNDNILKNNISEREEDNNFNIMDFSLKIDLMALNRDFIKGNIDVIRNLRSLTSLVAVYKCDILLLTGCPTQIPGIRTYIKGLLPLSTSRIIQMNNYKCLWYPIKNNNDSTIGDPKTTVAVGAILATKKLSYRNLKSFRINPIPILTPSSVRILGGIDEKGHMKESEVLYKFECKADKLLGGKDLVYDDTKARDSNNYEMNTTKESRKEFTTTLVKTLGYRQINNSNFPANYLYSLEVVSNLSNKDPNNLNTVFKLHGNEEQPTNYKNIKNKTVQAIKESVVYNNYLMKDEKLNEYFTEMENKFDDLINLEEEIHKLQDNIKHSLFEIEQRKRQEVSEKAYQEASYQIEQEYANKSVGFLSKIFGGESKQVTEKQVKIRELSNKIISSKESEIQSYLVEQSQELENEIAELQERIKDLELKPEIVIARMKSLINKNKYQEDSKNIVICRDLANDKSKFTFNIEVNNDNKYFNPYGKYVEKRVFTSGTQKGKPIRSLFEVLMKGKKLNECTLLEIVGQDVKCRTPRGEEYSKDTKYFVLKLKTCGGNGSYWTEDGLIYKL